MFKDVHGLFFSSKKVRGRHKTRASYATCLHGKQQIEKNYGNPPKENENYFWVVAHANALA